MFEKPAWKLEAEQRGESLPEYYTIQEAVRILNHADSSYLSRLAREGRILTYKIGTVRFMKPEQLEGLIHKK